MNGHMKPADIEKRSFAIITEELGGRTFPESVAEVVKRVIHTSADFDYAANLCFSPDAVEQAKAALKVGDDVCAGLDTYTREGEGLLSYRARIGKLLSQVQ